MTMDYADRRKDQVSRMCNPVRRCSKKPIPQMLLYVIKERKENAMQSLSWELCLHAMVSFGVVDQAVSVGRSPW
jgi:hypothetical protein